MLPMRRTFCRGAFYNVRRPGALRWETVFCICQGSRTAAPIFLFASAPGKLEKGRLMGAEVFESCHEYDNCAVLEAERLNL